MTFADNVPWLKPWTVKPDRFDPEMYEVDGAYLVASGLPLEDATIIAACHDMLAALRQASWLLADISPDGLVKAQVDKAIVRATGC